MSDGASGIGVWTCCFGEKVTGQSQAAAPHLSRGEAACAPPRWSQEGDGPTGADAHSHGPNQRWSLDFVSDQMTDCRRFGVLTVVDEYTRDWQIA